MRSDSLSEAATRHAARRAHPGALDLRGTFTAEKILEFGVDRLVSLSDDARVETGAIDSEKRLRPNMRDRRMVLVVKPRESGWLAQRVS